MAGHALACDDRWMGIGHFRCGGDLVVAHEAEVGLRRIQAKRFPWRGLVMAGIAGALGHGWVGRALQHAAAVGAMGVMAGHALTGFNGVALVLGLEFLRVVAGDAQFFDGADQALGERPCVWQMAAQAVPRGCG